MKNDKPKDIDQALEMMRFGCPFVTGGIGDYDVKRFENRMLACAMVVEEYMRTHTIKNLDL